MSKRHLEPEMKPFSTNRKSTLVHSRGIVGDCMEDRMENFSGGRWRRTRMNCNGSSGSGSLKRPRPVTLKPFDFSLIKGESSAIDSQNSYPETSEDTNTRLSSSVSGDMSVPNASSVVAFTTPPTMILPFLFLGSQNDALSKEFIKDNGITHILNASTTCPKSPYIINENFLRIPVNDSHTERLLPYFEDVKKFLDGCCKVNGRALVHCLAGISRSPTLVIAYIMSHLRLSQDDAYIYVKRRRASISPNFNFLGQLMEFESILHNSSRMVRSLSRKADGTFYNASPKKLESENGANSRPSFGVKVCVAGHVQSPTTAFAKLSFDRASPSAEDESEFPRSDVGNKESNEIAKRSKPASSKSVSLNNDYRVPGLCVPFPNMTDPESAALGRCSVNFQSNEMGKGLQNRQTVSGALAEKPVFAEHCLRKISRTESKECTQNARRTSPPARPSSIAISGLQFDLGLLGQDIPTKIKGMILSDAEICGSPMTSYGVLSCVTEACKKLHVGCCSCDLLRQVESACRSRSFNDIPAVAASALASNGAVFNTACSSVMEASKTSSGVVDRAWKRALDGHTSNSSLSSVGSSSVHGSRELVQVS